MAGKLTWEEETRIRLGRAKEALDSAKNELNRRSEHVSALEKVLELEAKGLSTVSKASSIDYAALRNMSVNDACVKLAQDNGGVLLTKTAIKKLCEAGVFQSANEARDNLYSTLKRSKGFRKERPGVWHLIHVSGRVQSPPTPKNDKPVEAVTKVIERMLDGHPDWKHKDLLSALIAANHDFQGKKPGNVVNMAVQRIKLQKVKPLPKQQTTESSPANDDSKLRLVGSP